MNSAIIIFAYNRPRHLNQLLLSLEENKISSNQKIYLFCDGPKNKKDLNKINEIKKLLKKTKLKISKKIFRKKNIGLSQNIIKGVTLILKKYESCIVIEDDLLLNSSAIKYMNKMLYIFKKQEKIGSISAYSYLQNYKKYKNKQFYTTKRHCSWCWGTWSRVWNKFDWDQINYLKHFSNNTEIKNFSEAGRDLNLLLWGHYKKYINSWAIRFNYFCHKHKYLSLQPRFSMVLNNGQDSSGTHEKFKLLKNSDFNFHPKLDGKSTILKKIIKSKDIDAFIKKKHKRSMRLSLKYILENKKII